MRPPQTTENQNNLNPEACHNFLQRAGKLQQLLPWVLIALCGSCLLVAVASSVVARLAPLWERSRTSAFILLIIIIAALAYRVLLAVQTKCPRCRKSFYQPWQRGFGNFAPFDRCQHCQLSISEILETAHGPAVNPQSIDAPIS